MVNVHRVHLHERDDLCSRTELSSESITNHTSQAATLEEQYKFFQEMRGYVRDLVECLNEKVGAKQTVCC
jgi:GC-rich sequence DNA-binding factor